MANKYLRTFKWLIMILAGSTFVLSITLLPEILSWMAWRFPEVAYLQYPALIFLWITLIGFYYMVVLVLQICSNIQDGKGFTVSNAKLFDRIAFMALLELIAYLGGFITVAVWLNEAHPSFIFALFLVAFVCLVIFGFCKVMQHLLQRVADIKEENEYTV